VSLLEVKDLRVYFPVAKEGFFKREKRFVHAVDGVDLEMEEAKTLGLVGESGCGKSTLGRSILKLIKATSGSIKFEDKELMPLTPSEVKPLRKKFQMIFQNPFSSLDPRMTVLNILSEPLKSLTKMNKGERRSRVEELLENVNLNPKFLSRYPHEFSGGQRQRINIARALAVSPKLIVADEPVSALDVSIQAQIINLLQDLQEKYKLSFLFIAHDLSVVKTLSHRVAVMYLGKIVEISETKTLYDHPRHPYTKALMSAVPIPDPKSEASRKRIALKGEIPSPINKPTGCSFHPRCPYAKERCKAEEPILREISEGAKVSCHFAEEI